MLGKTRKIMSSMVAMINVQKKKKQPNIYCTEVYFIAPKEHDKMEEVGAL